MKYIQIRKIVLFAFIAFSASSMFSQISGETLELPNFTPPSPSAYELGRYGEVPIGLFTGVANVSVPLIEFKTKNLSIPISLSYNSNGIKVDQLATKVGLGWSLNAGGVISRIVNQNPDELRVSQQPENADINTNLFTPDWINYFFDMNHQVTGISQPVSIDGEPDIFSFNFLGRTGRFTFNNQQQIVLLDNIALTITYDPEGNGGFLIIDENGVKYYFIDTESTRLDTIGGQTQYNNIGHYMATSWSITRIETPKNEQIFFEYTDETYNYVTSKSQSASITTDPLSPSSSPCNVPALSPTKSPIINNILLVNGKRLSRISSNNPVHGSVTFQYGTAHPEITNYSLLSSITQLNKLNTPIETANFNYSTVSQRMFLDQVNFSDPEKKYSFEYTDLSQFPERLSFSRDHWGYYNGKSNLTLFPDLSGLNNALGNRFHIAFNDGANKEIDETKAKKGLLKKITYPTKGYTQIDYESNTNYDNEVIPSSEESVQMVVSRDGSAPIFQETSESFILDDVAEDVITPITVLFGINYQSCSQGPHPPIADRELFVEIENLTTPSQVNTILMTNQMFGNTQGIGHATVINEDDALNNEYFFNLRGDDDYQITIKVYYQCLMGDIRFNYPNGPSQLVYSNKKTGGLRVSKTTNFDHNNQVLSSKKYYYAAKNNLDQSSGIKGFDPHYYSTFFTTGVCDAGGDFNPFCVSWTMNYVRLNSGSLRALYRSSTQNTRYKYVTVSEDADDFSNGGVEYQFKLTSMSQAYSIMGIYSDSYSEGQRDWGNGLELQKTYFKVDETNNNVFKTVLKEINNYERDSRINEVINGYKVSRKYVLGCRAFQTSDTNEQRLIIAEDEFNVTRYYLTPNWTYLSSKITETYDIDGLSPITTTTNYFYDNPDHAQVTRTEMLNSEGDLRKTITKYPQDISSKTSAELKLITQNRIGAPIEVLSYQKEGSTEKLLSHVYNEYHDWGSDIVEPQKIKASKNTNTLEDRITYHDYDTKGNPLEVSKTDGSHICYIWGYNNQYPIAKIENANYSQVSDYVTNLEAKSNADNDRTLNYLGNEGELREALDQLRENPSLNNAMITTYTYDPLIGVTSITDPKGYTIYYEYDEYQRLKLVRDQDNNIVSKNEYHYKN